MIGQWPVVFLLTDVDKDEKCINTVTSVMLIVS